MVYNVKKAKRIKYGQSHVIYDFIYNNPNCTTDDIIYKFRIKRPTAHNYRWRLKKYGYEACVENRRVLRQNPHEENRRVLRQNPHEENNVVSISPDSVGSPEHYTDGGIETIDYIRAKLTPEEFRGMCVGNALKYCSRSGKKDIAKADEDLAKAAWFLNYYLERK